jgi:hypothetical protein
MMLRQWNGSTGLSQLFPQASQWMHDYPY